MVGLALRYRQQPETARRALRACYSREQTRRTVEAGRELLRGQRRGLQYQTLAQGVSGDSAKPCDINDAPLKGAESV